MLPALVLLLLHFLIPALTLEHDYFASYYGNEGTENKWGEPDALRRQDSWPPGGSKSGPPPGPPSGPASGPASGPPSGHSGGGPPVIGADGTVTKYGNDEIYWGPNPPPHSEVFYGGYPSHHSYMHPTTTTTTTTTTKAPPKDTGSRISKKPYSYYFIGRKLWYIPLYFAIYYTLYVGALIIKAIARHRINLPPGYGREMGNLGLTDLIGKAIHEVGRRYL